MNMSAEELKLLMTAEGFCRHIYRDAAGLETIGYGHRVLPGENFLAGITDEHALALLEGDLAVAETAVERLVQVPLTQGQFDALVDFVFNLGAARLAESTLLKELNASRYAEAANQFARWDYAAGRELDALKARRHAEVTLWNQAPPVTKEAA